MQFQLHFSPHLQSICRLVFFFRIISTKKTVVLLNYYVPLTKPLGPSISSFLGLPLFFPWELTSLLGSIISCRWGTSTVNDMSRKKITEPRKIKYHIALPNCYFFTEPCNKTLNLRTKEWRPTAKSAFGRKDTKLQKTLPHQWGNWEKFKITVRMKTKWSKIISCWLHCYEFAIERVSVSSDTIFVNYMFSFRMVHTIIKLKVHVYLL